MKSFNTRRQQGFSLIEILLVIGIIAVLALAAFLIFPSVQASQRANAEQNNIMTIAAGVKQMFNGKYTNISTLNVVQGKLAPANMVDTAGTALVSAWGGAVTVAESAGSGVAGSRFTITYAEVPAAVCLKLAPGLIGNFESVSVGGTAVTTPANIIAQCNSGTGGVVPVVVTSI